MIYFCIWSIPVGHHSAYLHPQTVSKPWVSAAGTHPCRSNRYLNQTHTGSMDKRTCIWASTTSVF